MNDRQYRLALLLLVYPKPYRENRGDEILGTLLQLRS